MLSLQSSPENVLSPEIFSVVEQFVVLLYERTSEITNVNEARRRLFPKKKMLDNIPPTKAALEQHLKRAVFQGVFVWGNFGKLQNLPSPEEWGWEKVDRGYSPVWSTLPDVWKSVQELISCTCKKGCKKRCKCVKAGLKCCALCDCEGDCVEGV